MTIRITWARAVATLLALGAAGMLFAWSGIFNIAASSGHWPITDWFLHWTMRNSVKTHSFFDAPSDPRATDGDLVSAAGHFAQACASCHGAPGLAPLPVMQKATPPAPNLSVNAREWSDRHLFYILKHGVKYTGMPAWGAAGREDEVRRMVAFVRQLPSMNAAQYRALSGTEQGMSCASCHGMDGRGRGQGDIPVLGGQNPAYLAQALDDYASGRRASAVMAQAAARLDPEQRRQLAVRFAAQPGLGGALPSAGDPRARLIAERGLPDRQLPACASCHAPGKPQPVLAGQKATYIAQRLRDWRGKKEVIDARKPQDVMPVIARRIPEDMIEPLARYLSGGAH